MATMETVSETRTAGGESPADAAQAAARDVLKRSLAVEARHPVRVHPEWARARHQLRDYLLSSRWDEFLRHPVCRHMFVRGRWGLPQDFERERLGRHAFGRKLLATMRDPAVGSPRTGEQLPGVSTNLLGMAYYLLRVQQQCGGRLPASVVEIGGGYGALAALYAGEVRRAAYTVVDLPEMLALQHYYLSRALPGRRVYLAESPEQPVRQGEVALVPVSLIDRVPQSAELTVSTFAYSEMPAELQAGVRARDWFGAKHLFLAGQLSTEAPRAQWVDHGQVVGPVMQAFPRVLIEKFHFGDNYLLTADRKVGEEVRDAPEVA